MLYLIKRSAAATIQVHVKPDDAQANALRQKRAALSYTPENGFHKDRKQDRLTPGLPPGRWAPRPV